MENHGKTRICMFPTVNTNEHLVTTSKVANYEVSREFSNQQWISGNCRVKRCFQPFNHKTPSPSADQPQTDQDRCIYPDNILASVWNTGLLWPANNLFPPHFLTLTKVLSSALSGCISWVNRPSCRHQSFSLQGSMNQVKTMPAVAAEYQPVSWCPQSHHWHRAQGLHHTSSPTSCHCSSHIKTQQVGGMFHSGRHSKDCTIVIFILY